MSQLQHFKRIYGLVKKPNLNSLLLSLADTHHKGVFSLVIHGEDFGRLIRVFIADKKIKPYEVQLHSHRYPLRITVIKGNVRHYIALRTHTTNSNTVQLSEFEYKSPLNGGSGLKHIQDGIFVIKDNCLPIGASIEMSEKDIHTMSCSKGSIWIVEELGFKTESSIVLGVPFITEGLYNKPEMFQINDHFQIFVKELKQIINHYENV